MYYRLEQILVAVFVCFVFFLSVGAVLQRKDVQEFIRQHPALHPNSICYFRVLIGWLGTYLYFVSQDGFVGILLFTFSAVLDGVDGLVAAKCGLITEFGKKLDPACDKATYLPPLFVFAVQGVIELWLVAAFATIEVLGQTYFRWKLEKKGMSVGSIGWGKIKTVLVFSLVIYCALSDGHGVYGVSMADELMAVCVVFAVCSIVFKFIGANHYADLVSGLNLACGMTGIVIAASGGSFIHLLDVIILGQLFDLFDGRLAKRFGSTKIGPTLDTIADFFSFGLCPAVWYFSQDAPFTGTVFCLGIAYRLVRYMYGKSQGESGDIFTGLPSPAGALMAFGLWAPLSGTFLLPIAMLGVSCLTVSKLKFAHFGRVIVKRMPRQAITLLSVGIIFLVLYANKAESAMLFCLSSLAASVIYAVTAYFCVPVDILRD